MLKLKLQYFGHLMRRVDSLEKILMLGKLEGGRKRGCQRIKWLDIITNSTDMSLNTFQELVMDREAWCVAVYGVTKSRTGLWLNWTDMFHHCKIPNLNIFESQYCHLYNGDCKTYFTELFIVFWECAQSRLPVVGTQLLVTVTSITEWYTKLEEGSPALIQLIKANF